MKLFLDTNIWLRYFLRDTEEQAKIIDGIIESIEEGRIKPYSSSFVILECVYVWTKLYEIPKDLVVEQINTLLSIRNLTLIESTNFIDSWTLYQETKEKLSDCFILKQVPDDVSFCSFDRKLMKLAGKKGILPKDVVLTTKI